MKRKCASEYGNEYILFQEFAPGVVVAQPQGATIIDEPQVRGIEKQIRRFVDEHFGARTGEVLVYNLSQVAFFSSAAQGALFYAQEKAEQTGNALIVAGVAPAILDTFKITRLHEKLSYAQDAQQAASVLAEARAAGPERPIIGF